MWHEFFFLSNCSAYNTQRATRNHQKLYSSELPMSHFLGGPKRFLAWISIHIFFTKQIQTHIDTYAWIKNPLICKRENHKYRNHHNTKYAYLIYQNIHVFSTYVFEASLKNLIHDTLVFIYLRWSSNKKVRTKSYSTLFDAFHTLSDISEL